MADNSHYQIGYAKPPPHNRFEKGQSGNPRGRPKGAKNLNTVLENALSERVTVTVNGKRTRISKLEAAITQMVNRAAGGDNKALAQLLPQVQAMELRSELNSAALIKPRESDLKVMESLIARLGQKGAGDGA